MTYLSSDSYFISFLNNTQPLPPLSRSTTPVKLPKFTYKKLTPVLSSKPEQIYIKLSSGNFSKFIAISLKTAFNSVSTKIGSESLASPLVLANSISRISEMAKYAPILEDLAILHDKVSFKQVIEIICSDAKEDQIEAVLDWVKDWDESKMKGLWRKNKSAGKRRTK